MITFLGNKNIDVYKDFIESTRNDKPDIIVSCQYPLRIPEQMVANHICVNLHYGILPYFAGVNPIYWQIKTSDVAGVTLHYVDNGFDSGDIISIDTIPIGDLTADELFHSLEDIALELLKKFYKSILKGTAPRQIQDLSKQRYYNKEAINFRYAKYIDGMNDKSVRALHFVGKQYPIVTIGNNHYELRKVCE